MGLGGSGAIGSGAAGAAEPPSDGAMLYSAICQPCHQDGGVGVEGKYPPLAGSEWVLAQGPARMVRIALDAVQGPITVKGAEKLRTELQELKGVQRPAIITAIAEARSHGDLSENAPIRPTSTGIACASSHARKRSSDSRS